MLSRRFRLCSTSVKRTLFLAFCATLYTCELWVNYKKSSIERLRVQYNNAFRSMFGLPRYCSASGMFTEGRIPGFAALIRSRVARMRDRISSSRNILIMEARLSPASSIYAQWRKLLVPYNIYINYRLFNRIFLSLYSFFYFDYVCIDYVSHLYFLTFMYNLCGMSGIALTSRYPGIKNIIIIWI